MSSTAMLDLEIRYGDRKPEIRQISKSQAVSIGRHGSNDICIDEPQVAPIHCRVLWNKTKTYFEVASANRDGVDLNGTMVRNSGLKGGDVLRIGSVDLIVREPGAATRDPTSPPPTLHEQRVFDAAPSAPTRQPSRTDKSGTLPLAPITEETPASREGWDRKVLRSVSSRERGTPPRPEDGGKGGSKPVEPAAKSADHSPPKGWQQALLDDVNDEMMSESEVPLALWHRSGQGPPEESFAVRLSQRLSERQQVRPGEQEALRSPFILGMLGLTLALALAAGAIYFVIGRESTQQEYTAAQSEYEAKRYGQAADLFDKFLQAYPRDNHAAEAQYRMWNARVLKEIAGGSPAWKRGLEAVDKYVDANRDRRDFHDHFADLSDFLTQIALGAAHSAENSKDRELLDVSSAAQAIAARYYPDGKVPADVAARIQAAFTKAQDAIVEQSRFSAKIAEIEKANADRHPMEALAARRSLLALYPEVVGDPRLAKLLEKTLNVEKSLVVEEDPGTPARTKELNSTSAPHVCLVLNTRSHTEESAGTRPVFVLAKDCCYAVDHVTGEPIWRRVIGLDSPFLPLNVATSVPGLLLFDTNHLSLMLVARQTGKLIWEQPINEAVSGAPLIDQAQIYLATQGNHLDKIDLETGRLVSRLTFSQKILSPPAPVHNNERLVVAGNASLIYTLTTSPLRCLRVTDLGHDANTLVNGMISIGSLVLVTESGRPSGTRLHVLEARSDENWLKPVKVETIEGAVRDPPVIYGKMLFVASSPARISAFSVSDAPGQEALVATSTLAIPKQEESPLFLSAGPDGQLWMAGSSLRRLQLKLNAQSFVLDSAETAVGISSQPLQIVGQYLFAARRLPYASSVFLSQIDREPMVGQWRTIFGSSIIGHLPGTGGDIVAVGEAGEVFNVSLAAIDAGGFKRTAATSLDPAAGTRTPLRATPLADAHLAVDCGGPKPTVWLIGPGGQLDGSFHTDEPLEAGPVRLAAGLVLPLPGKLRLASASSGLAAGEDYLAPVENKKSVRWFAVCGVGQNGLIAVDSRGRLTQLQYRAEPVRHLAEVRSQNLDRPLDIPFVVVGSRVVYADAGGVLHVLDAETLDSVFTEHLPSPAVNRLWSVGSTVLVETRSHQLLSYEVSGSPKLQFRVPLGNTGPAGPPSLVRGRLVVANRDGTLLALDPASGAVAARAVVGQPLSGGVISVGDQAVVASIDGTLYHVDSILEQPKKNP
jgi:outer membrane protein assembly factor BamB/tetratricopeptide (TPR) repeat protein